MDYREFLISKKIDPELFKKEEAEVFIQWKSEFEQMHPKSFEARKLFKINAIRRKYKYDKPAEESQTTRPSVKPVIKPKIKR